eukprot:scaffold7630_cov122-Isochrysis_galbana.AAC.5
MRRAAHLHKYRPEYDGAVAVAVSLVARGHRPEDDARLVDAREVRVEVADSVDAGAKQIPHHEPREDQVDEHDGDLG